MLQRLFFVGLFLLALLDCGKKPDSTTVVAKVGKAVLTVRDLEQSIPPEYSMIMGKKQYEDYVNRWVENEILFREAKRLKIEKIPRIARQIEKAKRDILVAEAINQLCPPTSDVSEARIQQYYEERQSEFIRSQWEIKTLHILIPGKRKAWNVRSQVTADNFLELARRHSIIPVDDPNRVPFVSANDMPVELADKVFNIRVGGTTPPIKTSRGYHIIRVLDKKPPNSLRSLMEVREEIINRLTAEKQKNQVKRMLEKLQSSIPVELHVDRLPDDADSTATATPEIQLPESVSHSIP